MRALAVCLVAICLPGCASVFDGPVPARDKVYAQVELVDEGVLPPGVSGDALCANGRCIIRIRRSTYPRCITHEFRHAFEPHFHEGRDSDEDCYTKE